MNRPRIKTIMDSHETYIQLLTVEVSSYAMAELETLEKRTRNSRAYKETNEVYLKEIAKRKNKINGG